MWQQNNYYKAFLLAALAFFLYADQNLMSPNLTIISREFNLTDAERDQILGGDLSVAFFLVGGLAALTLGYATDKVNRVRLLTAVVICGEGFCFLSAFAQELWQLFICRTMTGIAVGGTLPITFSIVGDLFPRRERTRISGWMGVAMGLGITCGQGIAGILESWRTPFLVISIPAIILAVIFVMTVTEPIRGAAEDNHSMQEGTSTLSIFKIKSNLLMYAQGIPGCVPWSIVYVFLNDYFLQDRNAGTKGRATAVVTSFGIGCVAGGLVGGYLGQMVYNARGPTYVAYLMGSSTIIGTVPLLYLINASFSYILFICIAFVGGFIACITSSNVRAQIINVNLPGNRGRTLSIFNLTDDVGKGLGPAIISIFLRFMSRQVAFTVGTTMWIICGALLLSLSYTVTADEQAVKALVSEEETGIMLQHVEMKDEDENLPNHEI